MEKSMGKFIKSEKIFKKSRLNFFISLKLISWYF